MARREHAIAGCWVLDGRSWIVDAEDWILDVSSVISTEAQRSGEYAVRGRRRMDCIGCMVMQPSEREVASQRASRAETIFH